jgi:hypothetical protein
MKFFRYRISKSVRWWYMPIVRRSSNQQMIPAVRVQSISDRCLVVWRTR